MFAKPAAVLRSLEGSLSETPLPLLLQAVLVEERSLTLELKVRQLEKRIYFEEGALVGCRSNLLHETLGKFLVEKGKLAEADYQKALGESVQTGRKLGELLVAAGKLAPFDLYKQLQANLAHQVLDCFRWTDARYRLLGDDGEPPEASVKMNTPQLILTGVSTAMPFDAVATHFAFTDERRFAPVPSVAQKAEHLKLSAKDTRLLQALRQQPTFTELLARVGLELEEGLRRLYALCVLGLVCFADEMPAEEPAPPPAPVVAPAPQVAAGLSFLDSDEGARNALAQVFLEHRSKDPFGLLEVAEDVQPLPLRRAFLAKAERFNPARFQTAELKDKAEVVLLACARAYGALSDPEQREAWGKRRAAALAKQAAPASRPSADEQFRIRTALLDAGAQLEAGKRKLEAQNWRGALELFEYACDIEPKSLHRAYLAWARYRVDPARHVKLALGELAEVTRVDPDCEEGYAFMGDIHRERQEAAEAEAAYRRAFKVNPKQRRYVQLIQDLMKKSKTSG